MKLDFPRRQLLIEGNKGLPYYSVVCIATKISFATLRGMKFVPPDAIHLSTPI